MIQCAGAGIILPMTVVKFANRMAAFAWGFAAVWLAMLLAFTWLYLRDGAPPGNSDLVLVLVLCLFWLGGTGLVAHVLSTPLMLAAIDDEGKVSLVWRYPHKQVRKIFEASSLKAAAVVEDRDSDGDPYFVARLNLPDGSFIDLAEGHDLKKCQGACDRFAAALVAHAKPNGQTAFE
jgi:hypothetical protein